MSEQRKSVQLEGVVEVSEPCNGYYEVRIGGRDVSAEVSSVFWGDDQVEAILWIQGNETRVDGDFYASEGEGGYSSWTPGWGPEVCVGGKDILDDIEDQEGRTVALLVREKAGAR